MRGGEGRGGGGGGGGRDVKREGRVEVRGGIAVVSWSIVISIEHRNSVWERRCACWAFIRHKYLIGSFGPCMQHLRDFTWIKNHGFIRPIFRPLQSQTLLNRGGKRRSWMEEKEKGVGRVEEGEGG